MLDLTKPVQLRDGTPARIISTALHGADTRYPIGVLVTRADGREDFDSYTMEGKKYVRDDDNDPSNLVNAPNRKVSYRTFDWCGLRLRLGSCVETSLAGARALVSGWDGVLKITEEDGKFLSAEVVPADASA